MERIKYPILSLMLIFGTLQAHAVPAGEPKDYSIKTKYICNAAGVTLHNNNALISDGTSTDEVVFVASPGKNQTLSVGGGQYLIWPRMTTGSFEKSLNLLVRKADKKYQIVQEVDLGDSQKTKTNLSMTTKNSNGEERFVFCRVEMEWVKKTN